MTSRLLAAFAAFGMAVLLVLVVPLAVADRRSTKDDLVLRIERDAVAVAAVATPMLQSDDPATDTEDRDAVLRYLHEYTEATKVRVVVTDEQGDALVDTAVEGGGGDGRDFSTRPEIAKALGGVVASGERRSNTLGYPLLYVAVPVASGGVPLGSVRITWPASELDERVTTVRYALASLALVVLAVGMVLGLLIARWVVRPLQRLEHAAELMGEGDLTVRADAGSGPRELRALASSFNGSVATIERLVLAQQEFVADASHQLRTPLHALRLRLENAAWQVEQAATDPSTVQAVELEPMITEVDRLAALVTSLLVLARADKDLTATSDGGVDPDAGQAADVATQVDAQLDGWRLLGGERGVALHVDVAPGLVAHAAPLHVDQVLGNLVDNAIQASGVGDEVRIVASAVGGEIEVRIEDAGPGMTAEQAEAAFHRFGRSGDTSPTTHRSGGGFGLGLAIVQRLLDVDGGSIRLERRDGGGLAAVVRWPAASA